MFKHINRRASLIGLFLMSVIPLVMASPDDLTFTVDTQLGTGATFTIPTYGTGYNYDVDCDTDGTYEATGQTGNYTCDYSGIGGSGVYTIQIKDAIGDGTGFPRVRFNDLGEANEITELIKWGAGIWDTMDSTFEGARNMTVTTIDVPNFKNVISMKDMFYDAVLANPDTSNWVTTKVEDMSFMFYFSAVSNPDTSNWNTANVTDMSFMFYATDLVNLDTSNWDTSHVTNMRAMFYGTEVVNLDTSDWDTANVEDMSFMFYSADVANLDTSNWDTSKVTAMLGMFQYADSVNPDTSDWDTSNVTNMNYMFFEASSVNPDVSNWDITAVTKMNKMFDGVTLPIASYDAILVNFNSQAVQSGIEFSGGDSKYCTGLAARNDLINTHGWIITDDGLDPLCDDIIFRNSFELPVVVFNASEKQFSFDFALLNSVKLDSYPELIAVGLDAEQHKVIKFHVRKIAEQMQIRISDLDQDAFDENTWFQYEWQNIGSLDLTTVTW